MEANLSKKIKDGFTLVELLAVIVVLGLTITIGFNTINRAVNNSKEKAYKEQVDRIIKLAKTWSVTNTDKLPEGNEIYHVSLDELRNEKLLEGEVINPKDNSNLSGCIKITYNQSNSKHEYNFEDTCPDLNAVYNIEYNLNGGTLSKANPTTYTYQTKTFTLNNPSKEGYIFNGWRLSSTDTPNPNMKVYKGTTGNLSFEAIFTYDLYVTIDLNGGFYSDNTEVLGFYSEPNKTEVLKEPQRYDYIFAGWTANVDDVTIDGNNVTIGTTSVTLTANWKEASFSYTYTGEYSAIDDGDGNWRIKFLTDGDFTVNQDIVIDAFLVGGGGAGGSSNGSSRAGGGGGGGKANATIGITLYAGETYSIVVGEGASSSGGTGETTKAFGYNASGGTGGSTPTGTDCYVGGAGGSGGSGGGLGGANCSDNYGLWGSQGGLGGSNGSDAGGKGQAPISTCEFSEEVSAGVCKYTDNGHNGLYSGGGSGGGSYTYGCASSGGPGGGGNGGCDSVLPENGAKNTGGGGGGGAQYQSQAGGKGGSGIVVIRNTINADIGTKIEYTGSYEVIDDGDGNWRIKFLTSGTFKAASELNIDVFLVGGGGNGGSSSGNVGGGGGGGGKTTTVKNVTIVKNTEYEVVIGKGGGGTSSAFTYSAVGGTAGGTGYINSGGPGGSGGSGGSGGGYGGSNWSDGTGVWGASPTSGAYNGNSSSGSGQGTTTCEFGEEVSTNVCKYTDNGYDGFYAAGGGGGSGNGGCASGGKGGGGKGGCGSTVPSGGVDNTGSGGGGGANYQGQSGGKGGSGIVIIRNAQ